MARSKAKIGDVAEVTKNDDQVVTFAGPLEENDDGTYTYAEGVKGPADHDTFEENPTITAVEDNE